MLLKPLSVAALVAASATTNAFLIPPQLSELDIEVVEIIEKAPLPAIAEPPEKVTVEVDCPGCVIRGQDVTPSHLELSFSIDHRGSDRLLVNGFELYPSADPFQSLYALQVVDEKVKEEQKEKRDAEKLGYTLQVRPVAKDQDGNLELILVDLQIIEVGDVFVKGIENVRVKLIKAVGGSKLMIGSIETTASQNPVETEDGKTGEECTTLMCEWMAYAKDKMRKMKEHMKAKPCHGKGMGKGWGMGHGHHGGASPAHHGHHGFGYGHGHGDENTQRPPHFNESTNPHSVGKLFKNIASHILLPVLIGVVAGVSVSL